MYAKTAISFGTTVLRAIRCGALVLAGAGAAHAESGLPVYGVMPPEGMIDRATQDGFDAAMIRVMAVADAVTVEPPSDGWISPAMQRLAAVLAEEEQKLAQIGGKPAPYSRAQAEFLARALWLYEIAGGWEGMRAAAIRAVAIERQTSANAVFFGAFFPETFVDAAIGNQTVALEDVLFHLGAEAEQEHADGMPSPTRSEALAFYLAQAAFTGDTAISALRPIRSDDTVTADAALVRQVHGTEAKMKDVAQLDSYIADGIAFFDATATEASMDRAISEVGATLQSLASAQVDIADIYFPDMFSVADIQRSLKPDEAVVMVVPASPFVLLFAVTHDGFAMRQTTDDLGQLMRAAERLRAAIGWAVGRSAVPISGAAERLTRVAEFRAEAAAIYTALLGPVDELIRDKPRLFVVATARVGLGFPFELLLTEPARDGQDDRDLAWLVRRQAVQVVPTVELIWMRDFWQAPPPEKTFYAGFGAPDYARPSAAGRSNWATRILAGLRPLPEAADEVRQVAAAFGPENGIAVTGADASEYMVTELARSGTLGQMTVVHFATHGLVHGDLPDIGEPLLALTPMLDMATITNTEVGTVNAPHPDGALQAHEIRQLNLHARLVILSACNSGNVGYDQDGLTSLGAEFLAAGARRVMGTHWPIYSQAAVDIVTGMVERDPRLADPAMALRGSVLALIAQGGRKADPAYWAAFSLVGRP